MHSMNTAAKIFIQRYKRKQSWILYRKDQNINSLINVRGFSNEQLKIDNAEANRRLLPEASVRVERKDGY